MKVADGITTAVVGSAEVSTGTRTDRREDVAAKGDVSGLAEGLAVSDAFAATIEGRSEVAQVVLVGDGVGVGASLVGGCEEVAAEFHAQLRGEATPVTRGVGQGGGGVGEDDVLEGIVVLENVTAKGDSTVVLDVDALEARAVFEALVTDAGYAGGQGDLGKFVAVVEGIDADGGDARADGERGQFLTADEGVLADGGDAVLDGDALQVPPVPGGVGAPEFVNGFVAVFVRHSPAAADGQRGVLAVLLAEGPRGVGAARAADIAVGQHKPVENIATGEGDRVCRARL